MKRPPLRGWLTALLLLHGARIMADAPAPFTLSIGARHRIAQSAPFPVQPGQTLSLAFTYRAAKLTPAAPLTVSLHWRDAQGRDVDVTRAALGFPPLARRWTFSVNNPAGTDFSAQATAPGGASQAVVQAMLAPVDGPAQTATLENVRFTLGDTAAAEPAPDVSGPEDAGPVSHPDPRTHYVVNLVPNGALEDGDIGPAGWTVTGDTSGRAAGWQAGGAFSGRRCLRVSDTGPFVQSWDAAAGGPYVPGGAPDGNYADARSEVSARWVSATAPAAPGQWYQTSAFVWYGNRQERDAGEASPVRIQFLDGAGNVVPTGDVHDDWLPNADPFQTAGWVALIGKPLIAPPRTVSVRVAVALLHAFYSRNDGVTVVPHPCDRGFVLVDNISLYAVRGTPVPRDPNAAWQATARAGGLPFVPSSMGHRPHALRVQSETGYPGGILFAASGTQTESRLSLGVTNLLGDRRTLRLTYTVLDAAGKSRGHGAVSLAVAPFGQALAPISLPPGISLGPYTLRYAAAEGGQVSDAGETRFARMARVRVSATERARMDYPFGLWTPGFPALIGTTDEQTLGLLLRTSGAGKTWFGAGSGIYLEQYLAIQDPQALNVAIAKTIISARATASVWRSYGLTPMGRFEPPPQVVPPAEYARYGEIIAAFVSGLKGDIGQWRYGTEYLHGGVHDLDTSTLPPGQVNAQGSRDYLNWGRKGTVRQYLAEYDVARAAARRADPSLTLFGLQSAGDTNGDVARLFFQADTNKNLDAFGMNTYVNAFSVWTPNVTQFQKNGAWPIPLFIPEFAGRNESTPSGAGRFAAEGDAVRQMVTYWAAVLQTFPQFFDVEQSTLNLGSSDNNLLYQGRVRPQYVAFAVMAQTLGAGTFTARYDQPQAQVYVRKRTVPAGTVAVVWSPGPQGEADLAVSTPTVTVSDVYGNRRAVRAQNGVIALPLTPMPQYVITTGRIRPARTVQILFEHATINSTRSRIAVTVLNNQDAPLSGKLTVQSPQGMALIPKSYAVTAIKGGAGVRYEFTLSSAPPTLDHRTTFAARLVTPGQTYRAWGELNFAFAHEAGKPPAIDGDLSDWPEPFPITARLADQVTLYNDASPWRGPEDLSGRMALRWTDQYLYVAARVTDDVFSPPLSINDIFHSDCMELLIDVNHTLKAGAPLEQFVLAALPDGAQVRRYDGSLPQGQVTDARIAVTRRAGETDYEAAIPWRAIAPDFHPQAGRTISIAVSFDDRDGDGGPRKAISWFSPASAKNPANFGDVTLTRTP